MVNTLGLGSQGAILKILYGCWYNKKDKRNNSIHPWPHLPWVVQSHLGWWACSGLRSWQKLFRGTMSGRERESLFIPLWYPDADALVSCSWETWPSQLGRLIGPLIEILDLLPYRLRFYHLVPSSNQTAETSTCRWQPRRVWQSSRLSQWSGRHLGVGWGTGVERILAWFLWLQMLVS